MNMKQIVSIIMPVFNAEMFLRETLDSILRQTMNDFELIAVDDGSSDCSVAILKEYMLKDSRIKLLKTDHGGAAVARNKGIDYMSGAYAVFIDSDDLFRKDMLEKLLNKIIFTNADYSFCAYRKFDNTSRKTLWEFHPKKEFAEQVRLENNYCKNFLFNLVPPSPWGKIIKADLIKKYNLHFQNLSSCNDFAFSYSSLAVAEKISICDEVLLYYRANTKSSISYNRSLHPDNIIHALYQLYRFLISHNLFEDLKETFIFRGRESVKNEASKVSADMVTNMYYLANKYFGKQTAKSLFEGFY